MFGERDAAEELLLEWFTDYLESHTLDSAIAALEESPTSVLTTLHGAAAEPTNALDIGGMLALADAFTAVGLRADPIGVAALDVALACYAEIAKWPRPWSERAHRSSHSKGYALSSPQRMTADAIEAEARRLVACRSTPNPWSNAALHWSRIHAAWAYDVQLGHILDPNREEIACLHVARGTPELAAVIVTIANGLLSAFVESSSFTEDARHMITQELISCVSGGVAVRARWHAYLTRELDATPERRRLIEYTLKAFL